MNAIRRKVLIIFTMAMAAAVMMGGTAQADSKDFWNYATAGVGVYIPTGGLDDAGFDTGFAGWITYGRLLSDNLVFEGTIDILYSDRDVSGSTPVAGYYTRDDRIGVSAVMATLKGQIPAGPVMLFAGAGLGGYYASLDSDIETAMLGDFSADDDDTVWGVHVVIGATWDLNSRVFFGGQSLYRWTGDVNIDRHVGTVPVQFKGDLDGYAVTAFGGFRF